MVNSIVNGIANCTATLRSRFSRWGRNCMLFDSLSPFTRYTEQTHRHTHKNPFSSYLPQFSFSFVELVGCIRLWSVKVKDNSAIVYPYSPYRSSTSSARRCCCCCCCIFIYWNKFMVPCTPRLDGISKGRRVYRMQTLKHKYYGCLLKANSGETRVLGKEREGERDRKRNGERDGEREK